MFEIALFLIQLAQSVAPNFEELFAKWRQLNAEAQRQSDPEWWIVVRLTSDGDIYSIRRRNLPAKAGGSIPLPSIRAGWRTVWVQGDHSLNKSVTYRRTLTEYRFNCDGRFAIAQRIAYDRAGKVVRRWERLAGPASIVPETLEDGLEAAFCRG